MIPTNDWDTQACKWASENASSTEYENAADQKFAELIVKECAMQVADVRIENDFEPVGDAALVQALAGIKKYFGVEP